MTDDLVFSIIDNKLYLNKKILVIYGFNSYLKDKEKKKELDFITVDNSGQTIISLIKIFNNDLIKNEEFKNNILELVEY